MALSGALAQAFVRIRVDSSQVAADVNKGITEGAAGGDAEKAGSDAGSKFSKGFATAAKIGAGVALAIAAVGVASVDSAVKFQSQMTKIQTQAGATKGQVQQLTGAVLKLAPSTEQGPEQLAEALYHLKSVGLDNVQAMQALKTASDLAAVGGANLEDTTNAIAAAWRSGISGAQDFGQAAATVNAIIGAGNMKMTDFVTAMGTGILSAATTFGVSLKQVGGALALMTDEGVPAVDAATRLKMSFSLLAAPSITASKYLAQIGITGLQLANTMRSSGGLVSTIALLKQHLDDSGMSASQAAILLSHAFGGGRSSSAILTMINNLSTLKLKQDQINTGIGKYGAAVAAQRQTAEAQLKLLGSAFDTLGVKIGLAILPPLTKFVQYIDQTIMPKISAVTSFVTKLIGGGGKKGPTPAQQQATYTTAVARSLYGGTGGPGGAPPVLGVNGPLAPVTPARPTAPTIFPTQSTGGQTGLQVVNGIVTAMVKDAEKIGAAVLKMMAGIDWASLGKEAAMDAVPFIVGFVNNLGTAIISEAIHHPLDLLTFILSLIPIGRAAGIVAKVLGDIPFLGPLVKIFAKPLESAGGLVESLVGKFFKKAFGDFGPRLLEMIGDSKIGQAGEKIAMGLARGLGEGWRTVDGFFGGIPGKILGYVGRFAKLLYDPGIALIKGLIDAVTGKWGDAATEFKSIPGKILKFFAGAVKLLWDIGVDIVTGLLKGGEDKFPALADFVKSIPTKIKGLFADAGSWLLDAGKKIVQGLINGITGMIGSVGHAIGSVVSKIKAFLPFSPAKEGPLSGKGDPYYSGLSIGKKVAAGIAAALPALKSAVSGSVATINAGLAKAATQTKTGKTALSSLTAHQKSLNAERTKEESQIKKLVAEREAEYKKDGKASKDLRAEQEKQIKSLQKLRAAQETQVKQTEAVAKTLRAELSKLKSETTKLKDALAKATKAAAAASSSSASSDDSSDDSSDTPVTPNWVAFSQWLTDTSGAVTPAGRGGPGAPGGWNGYPGPFGGIGAGPRPVGRLGGPAMWMSGGSDELTPQMLARLDELIAVTRQQPGRTAAGLNAALNGVAAKAVVGGNW